MFAQSWENDNTKETSGPATGRATVREEYALLVAAKRGDSGAFEILCNGSAKMIFRVARRMMRNNEDAEDVLQESLPNAFIHLKSFKGNSRFSTWLSGIAMNAALMRLRNKRHAWNVSLDESPESGHAYSGLDIEDQGLNSEQLYAQKERKRILSEAMNELTPGKREAIELHELGERSSEEAAQIMGISVSAVKARVFHGRRDLRERLTHYVGLSWVSRRETLQPIDRRRHATHEQAAFGACD